MDNGPTQICVNQVCSLCRTSRQQFVDNPQARGRFVDNVDRMGTSDGTVTDRQTCLVWEKKTGMFQQRVLDCSITPCPDPHHVNNRYQWCRATHRPTGALCGNVSIATNPEAAGAHFLAGVNGRRLGGHRDWRLPSDQNLTNIVDRNPPACRGGSPCINSAFGPTVAGRYWSGDIAPPNAIDVDFANGRSVSDNPTSTFYVRAVRGFP